MDGCPAKIAKLLFHSEVKYTNIIVSFHNLSEKRKEEISKIHGSFVDWLTSSKNKLPCEDALEFTYLVYKAINDKVRMDVKKLESIVISEIERKLMHTTGFVSELLLRKIIRTFPGFETVAKISGDCVKVIETESLEKIVKSPNDKAANRKKDPGVIAILRTDLSWPSILKSHRFWMTHYSHSSATLVDWLIEMAHFNLKEKFPRYEQALVACVFRRSLLYLEWLPRTVEQVTSFLCMSHPRLTDDKFVLKVFRNNSNRVSITDSPYRSVYKATVSLKNFKSTEMRAQNKMPARKKSDVLEKKNSVHKKADDSQNKKSDHSNLVSKTTPNQVVREDKESASLSKPESGLCADSGSTVSAASQKTVPFNNNRFASPPPATVSDDSNTVSIMKTEKYTSDEKLTCMGRSTERGISGPVAAGEKSSNANKQSTSGEINLDVKPRLPVANAADQTKGSILTPFVAASSLTVPTHVIDSVSQLLTKEVCWPDLVDAFSDLLATEPEFVKRMVAECGCFLNFLIKHAEDVSQRDFVGIFRTRILRELKIILRQKLKVAENKKKSKEALFQLIRGDGFVNYEFFVQTLDNFPSRFLVSNESVTLVSKKTRMDLTAMPRLRLLVDQNPDIKTMWNEFESLQENISRFRTDASKSFFDVLNVIAENSSHDGFVKNKHFQEQLHKEIVYNVKLRRRLTIDESTEIVSRGCPRFISRANVEACLTMFPSEIQRNNDILEMRPEDKDILPKSATATTQCVEDHLNKLTKNIEELLNCRTENEKRFTQLLDCLRIPQQIIKAVREKYGSFTKFAKKSLTKWQDLYDVIRCEARERLGPHFLPASVLADQLFGSKNTLITISDLLDILKCDMFIAIECLDSRWFVCSVRSEVDGQPRFFNEIEEKTFLCFLSSFESCQRVMSIKDLFDKTWQSEKFTPDQRRFLFGEDERRREYFFRRFLAMFPTVFTVRDGVVVQVLDAANAKRNEAVDGAEITDDKSDIESGEITDDDTVRRARKRKHPEKKKTTHSKKRGDPGSPAQVKPRRKRRRKYRNKAHKLSAPMAEWSDELIANLSMCSLAKAHLCEMAFDALVDSLIKTLHSQGKLEMRTNKEQRLEFRRRVTDVLSRVEKVQLLEPDQTGTCRKVRLRLAVAPTFHGISQLTGVKNGRLIDFIRNAASHYEKPLLVDDLLSSTRNRFRCSKTSSDTSDDVLDCQVLSCLKANPKFSLNLTRGTVWPSADCKEKVPPLDTILQRIENEKIPQYIANYLKGSSAVDGVSIDELTVEVTSRFKIENGKSVKHAVQSLVGQMPGIVFTVAGKMALQRAEEPPDSAMSVEDSSVRIRIRSSSLSSSSEFSRTQSETSVDELCHNLIEAEVHLPEVAEPSDKADESGGEAAIPSKPYGSDRLSVGADTQACDTCVEMSTIENPTPFFETRRSGNMLTTKVDAGDALAVGDSDKLSLPASMETGHEYATLEAEADISAPDPDHSNDVITLNDQPICSAERLDSSMDISDGNSSAVSDDVSNGIATSMQGNDVEAYDPDSFVPFIGETGLKPGARDTEKVKRRRESDPYDPDTFMPADHGVSDSGISSTGAGPISSKSRPSARPNVRPLVARPADESDNLVTSLGFISTREARQAERQRKIHKFISTYLSLNSFAAPTEQLLDKAYHEFSSEHFARSRLVLEAYVIEQIARSGGQFKLGNRYGECGATWTHFNHLQSRGIGEGELQIPGAEHIQQVVDLCRDYLYSVPRQKDNVDVLADLVAKKCRPMRELLEHEELTAACRCLVLVGCIRRVEHFVFNRSRSDIYLRRENIPDGPAPPPATNPYPHGAAAFPAPHASTPATFPAPPSVLAAFPQPSVSCPPAPSISVSPTPNSCNIPRSPESPPRVQVKPQPKLAEALLLIATILRQHGPMTKSQLRDEWSARASDDLQKVMSSGVSFYFKLRQFEACFPSSLDDGTLSINEVVLEQFLKRIR